MTLVGESRGLTASQPHLIIHWFRAGDGWRSQRDSMTGPHVPTGR
jgi:hypothetical protein